MRQRLTKTVVEGAEHGTARILIWDSGDGATKGFGLKIEPSGKKVFVYQYRMAGGRGTSTKRYTIGEFSTGLTMAKAREIAEALEVKVRSGVDPLEEDKAKAALDAAQKGAQKGRVELVVADYIKTLKRRKPPLRSLDRVEDYLTRFIVGTPEKPGPWRGKLIVALTPRDIRDVLRTLAKKGMVASTRHVLAVLGPFFDYAITEEFRDTNPARGIGLKDFGFKSHSRKRYLSPDELKAVWVAADQTAYPFGPLVKLLILTAQRRDEVAGIRKSELNLETITPWKIPPSRAKNGTEHIVHLSRQALDVIESLPKTKHDLLFTVTGKTPISGFSEAKKDLDTKSGISVEKKHENWWLHDLRRTFATTAAEILKIPPHITDKILSHKSSTIKGVAAIYQKAEFLEERAAALDAWGNYVEALVTDKPANVILIGEAKRA